ncbi:MAG: hypothetical protein KGM44_08705, partial [bacterium]|nr:hypothetical protein [bacterium]
IIAYALIFVAMGVVYVRSRSVQINPTLYLMGYRLFYVTTTEGLTGHVLTRAEATPGDLLCVARRERLLLDLGVKIEREKPAA